MNPLKQYFRRPAIYLKLPSNGKGYPEGSIDMPDNQELPVYPMTAIDELTTKTPDSLFNGSAIVDVIKSCIPNIKDPWQIPSVDLNAILIAIRTASTGSTFDVESTCPKCSNTDSYQLDLSYSLQNIKSGDYNKPLKVGELNIFFRPLNYKSVNQTNLNQFNIQVALNQIERTDDEKEKLSLTGKTMREINENLFKIVAESIDRIELPNETVTSVEFILDFIRNTDKNTFDSIREYNVKLREESEIKPFKLKCTNCSNEYEQPLSLNTSDFFG